MSNKLIPDLRFPEFVNDLEWEEKPLGYYCDYWNGLGNESVITEDGQYYLISLNSIDIEGNLKSEMKMVPNTDNSLKKGDLVMVLSDVAHGNFLGLTAIIPDDNYVLNQRMAGLRIKDFNSIDPRYLRLFINGNQLYFKKQGQGSSQQNLSKGSVVNFPVLVPFRLLEQQKIASCLSSLDEIIAAHDQKLELLKDHKKGLMQNLFPQVGETVPKWRFKEFEGDGEWVEIELSKMGDLINGLTYSPNDVSNNGLLVLRSSNIQNGLIDLNDRVYVREDIKGANLTQPNDILVCVRNGSKNLIGKNAIIPTGIPLSTHGAFMTIFRGQNPQFAYQLFQTDFYERQVKADLGATINSINGKNFLKYKFPVPNNPKEQQKIASCLSSLDTLITAEAETIEQLKMHKKGMMQGLFPKIND